MEVESTCGQDLRFGFYGRGSSLLVTVPAYAQRVTVTVVDRLRHVPSKYVIRDRCSWPDEAEVTFSAIMLGHGNCDPYYHHNFSQPSSQPTATHTPTNWSIYDPQPPAPQPTRSQEPTSSPQPTTSQRPTPAPSTTQGPTVTPSSQPTSDDFTCPSLWDRLVPEPPLPYNLGPPGINIRRAAIVSGHYLRDLNAWPDWQVGRVWTMQVVVTSTCANMLKVGFSGNGGSHYVDVPPFAERLQFTVVDTVRSEQPASYGLINRCWREGEAEVTIEDVKLGVGDCVGGPGDGPTPQPTTPPPTVSPQPTSSRQPTPRPTRWNESLSYPRPTTSPAPTASPQPTLSQGPTAAPSASPAPSIVWTPHPTSEDFLCHSVWAELVEPAYPLPHTFTNTHLRRATVFATKGLKPLHELPEWAPGETWTLQMVVNSQCPNTLKYGFDGEGGSHYVLVPPMAQNVKITVVDQVRAVPSAFFQRIPCWQGGGDEIDVVFSEIKLGHGNCRDRPSPAPTVTSQPSPHPTSGDFRCHNLWPELVAGVALPLTTPLAPKWRKVVKKSQLQDLMSDDRWYYGAVFSLQVVVTSTCPHDVAFDFQGGGGFLRFTVPAFAQNNRVSVVDSVKSEATKGLQLTTECSDSEAEIVFVDIKLGDGGGCTDEGSTPTAPPTGGNTTRYPSAAPSTTANPTGSLRPTGAPTPPPTYEAFSCPDEFGPAMAAVQDPALQVVLPLAVQLNETRSWTTVLSMDELAPFNARADFFIGAQWSLQVTVTSTCSNALRLGFHGGGGSLNVSVPGYAQNAVLSATERLAFVPAAYTIQSRCRDAEGDDIELTITDLKLAPGECLGRTYAPTIPPTPASTPTYDFPDWPSASPTETFAPSTTPSPTRVDRPYPTMDGFTCGNDLWPSLMSNIHFPYNYEVPNERGIAQVFPRSEMGPLNNHPGKKKKDESENEVALLLRRRNAFFRNTSSAILVRIYLGS